MTREEIDIRRRISDFFKESARRARQDTCVLCGATCSSFANSHSVPRFVIKRIATNGKLITFSDIVGLPNHKNSVNNSWTFHIICSDCENSYFSAYESEEALIHEPTNKMMAQIALKDALMMLHKYRIDCESNKAAIQFGAFVDETNVLAEMNALDIGEMGFEIKRSKKIIDKDLKCGFKTIYYKVLDWVSPMAFQNQICLYKNIDDSVVNQIYSDLKSVRMQFLHVAVFPLKTKTVVMMFIHKDDNSYKSFCRLFQKLSDKEKLEYVNYIIFKHSEHALMSPRIDSPLLKSDKLLKLCGQNEANYYGYGLKILPSEIPNFLAYENSLKN